MAYAPIDAWEGVSGRRPDLVPPRAFDFVGGTDFVQTGDEFFHHFLDLAGLRPDERVLDVGCGIGRMARPLTSYLTTGSYEGFDIDRVGIRWCRRQVTPKYPNFRFRLANIHNLHYNPKGTVRPDEYRFPFNDGEFDFAFATSVFTHMYPRDVEHYLREVARVLKPGGRCLMTYFLANDEALELIAEGKSTIAFQQFAERLLVQRPKGPEVATCFPEPDVREMYGKAGLRIEAPIRFGSWPGRENFLSYQDMVIARKLSVD